METQKKTLYQKYKKIQSKTRITKKIKKGIQLTNIQRV